MGIIPHQLVYKIVYSRFYVFYLKRKNPDKNQFFQLLLFTQFFNASSADWTFFLSPLCAELSYLSWADC